MFFDELWLTIAGTLCRICLTSTAIDFTLSRLAHSKLAMDLVGDQLKKSLAWNVDLSMETAQV